MLTAPQRFILPFSVLLETLRGWHEPLILSATLPPAPEFGTGKAMALVQVVRGHIHSCTIVNAHGQLLAQQQAALTHLAQVDKLEWLVTSAVTATQVSRPCRLPTARLFVPATLSRRHRHLLLLLDGRKSVADLARVLRLPSHEIEALLLDLQQQQLLL